MSVRKFTANELIAYVRRQTRAPNSANTASKDSDFLDLINEALMAILTPFVQGLREDYFLVSRRITYSGATRVRIPERAVGQQVRSLHFVEDGEAKEIPRVDRARIASYGSQDEVFYLEGNSIVFPNGKPTGTLEIAYMARPGQLVLLEDARKITAVDTTNKTVTVETAVPSSWTTQGTFDVHSQHSGAELKQLAISKDTASGFTVSFTDAIDGSVFGTDAVEVGDFLVRTGEAALPALPVELHVALAQAATVLWLEGQGDMELLASAKQTLNDMLQTSKSVLTARIKSHPRKFLARNPLFVGPSGWF